MKRLWMLGLPLCLMCFSCDSNAELLEQSGEDVQSVSVTIEEIMNEEVVSRLLPTADNLSVGLWQDNDTLGVFPSVGGQVEFPILKEDVGKTTAHFNGGGWALKGGYSYSTYYPYNYYNRDSKSVPVSYLGQKQNGNGSLEHLQRHLFYASSPVQVKDGALSFNLMNIGVIQQLTLTMPVAKKWSSVTVYTKTEVFPVKSTINLQEEELPQTVLSYSDRVSIKLENVSTSNPNEDIVVYMVFPFTSDDNEDPLKVMVRDSEGYAYVADVKKSNGSDAYASFKKNTYQRRKASPVLQEGMNSGISAWEQSEEDFGGTLN